MDDIYCPWTLPTLPDSLTPMPIISGQGYTLLARSWGLHHRTQGPTGTDLLADLQENLHLIAAQNDTHAVLAFKRPIPHLIGGTVSQDNETITYFPLSVCGKPEDFLEFLGTTSCRFNPRIHPPFWGRLQVTDTGWLTDLIDMLHTAQDLEMIPPLKDMKITGGFASGIDTIVPPHVSSLFGTTDPSTVYTINNLIHQWVEAHIAPKDRPGLIIQSAQFSLDKTTLIGRMLTTLEPPRQTAHERMERHRKWQTWLSHTKTQSA